jgi:transposase
MNEKVSADGRGLDRNAQFALRLRAIKAVRKGMLVTDVAAAFGVHERTLYHWLARHASGGQAALHTRPRSGRPPKVTAQEMAWIGRTVQEKSPQQMKLPYALWTLSLIRELIQRHLGKRLALASVSRIMKLLGFSPQKPLYQAWQQDPVLVRRWEAETYPQIRAEARRVGAVIYFADESGIRSDYHTGTTWAPVGETPVVETTGKRFALNMISAVSPQGEFRFMLHKGAVTAGVFKRFLQRLLVGATRPVFVIVDGHPIHRARLVKDYVASTDGRLRLFHLPPYAPHLNPDEQVWAHVKRDVSKRAVQDLAHMKQLALGALRRIQKLPDLVRSFFHQPECQYILHGGAF